MNNPKIQLLIQEALEEEIPTSQISLWPAIQASLVAGNRHPFQQGDKMKTKKIYYTPRLGYSILIIAALLAVLFLTPQGRAFSQNVIKFFKPAENTTFPLQPSQKTTSEPDDYVPTAEPPSPLIDIAEAEAQAGFDIATLSISPAGFNFLGARLYGNSVSIVYEAQGGGGNLVLMQSQDGFIQSDWDKVPEDAIVPVKIGGSDGEFARGTFVVFPQDSVATWNPDAPILRLRWIKDGNWFEMTKFGDVKSIEYLDQAGLIELAESLID